MFHGKQANITKAYWERLNEVSATWDLVNVSDNYSSPGKIMETTRGFSQTEFADHWSENYLSNYLSELLSSSGWWRSSGQHCFLLTRRRISYKLFPSFSNDLITDIDHLKLFLKSRKEWMYLIYKHNSKHNYII